MKIKKRIIYISLILFFLFFTYYLLENKYEHEISVSASNQEEVLPNVELLKNMENREIPRIEEKIRKVQSELLSSKKSESQKNKLSKSVYKKIFESVVFMGDSQAEPLSLYGYTDSSSVIAIKGRNVISAKEDIDAVKSLSPQKIVMLYGVNDMLLFKTTDAFISHYKDLISSIQKQLPDTQIYVNSVYPVMDFVKEKKPLFKRSDDFNKALVKMCADTGTVYLDSASLLKSNSDYYAHDGIHFKTQYYPIWLEFIKTHIGI